MNQWFLKSHRRGHDVCDCGFWMVVRFLLALRAAVLRRFCVGVSLLCQVSAFPSRVRAKRRG